MIKLLIGGSPCTYWSIAQKNGRETTAEGMGWELFKNYLIAKEKFKPDFFLYENNKSAAQAIKDQIKTELGVWDGTLFTEDTGARYIEINSALVSAQNRQRFYVHNCGEVEQPEDRGILLRDILESGAVDREKSYALVASHQGNARDYFKKNHAQVAFETVPVNTTADGKAYAIKANTGFGPANYLKGGGHYPASAVAEPIRIGCYPSPDGTLKNSLGAKSGLYAFEVPMYAEPIEWNEDGKPTKAISGADGKTYPVYEVKDGLITIKGKQYPIKLADGYYIIRKLTVTECCRLQTMPDNYCRAVSNAQAYKGLGNGWTAEVIIHILSEALKDVPRDEEIVVLSMYDGIGTGRYCLDKMSFTNVKYFAYEIDKYAMQVAKSNYPDIVHMGDAFDLRHPDWTIGY